MEGSLFCANFDVAACSVSNYKEVKQKYLRQSYVDKL